MTKARRQLLAVRATAALAVAMCWAALGAIVGASECPQYPGDTLALSSFVLAGIIVFTPLGLFLHFVLGAKPRDALIGGTFGAMVALAAAELGCRPGLPFGLAVTMGGLFTSTFGGMIRIAQRLLQSSLLMRT